MYVLSVTPLATGLPHEELSYFSKDAVEPGDLVEVSVRKRVIRAVVLSVSFAKDQKQELRSAVFGIRKINKIISKNYIHPLLFQAFKDASSYHLIPLGSMIYDFLPEKLFTAKVSPLLEQKAKPGFDILLLQHSHADRITRYKSVIRESFAKKQSIVMFFPTIHDVDHTREALSRGIEDFVVSLHSGQTEKEWSASYKTITEEEHPLLILSTPTLVPWIRSDIGTIVIEREQSHYYYGHSERYDIKDVLIRLAKASRAKVILGAHLLSLQAYFLYEQKEAHEIMPLQYRNDTRIQVVPMHDESKVASPYLSKISLALLQKLHTTKKGHLFFYAHRKGMYPTTICSDCGSLFACEKCNRPYVLHKIGGVRTFICHECEHIIRVEEDVTLTCRTCGGWRLATLGIATTGIEEELQTLGIPTFCIDGERTNTRPKIKKMHDAWRNSDYGVLIGTEMAHNILTSADSIVVLSLDSLFSLPEYRTDEKILHLITEMAEKVEQDGDVIVQTRLPKMPVMKYLTSHTFLEFYKEELHLRDKLTLPPWYVVIKAKFFNLDDGVRGKLEEVTQGFSPLWFEAGGGRTLLFLHVPHKIWEEDSALRDRIRTQLNFGDPEVNPLHFFIDAKNN